VFDSVELLAELAASALVPTEEPVADMDVDVVVTPPIADARSAS
jgi:hypothetical protein